MNKLLQSMDVKAEVEARLPTPPRRGPMTGESSQGDAEYLKSFATAEELATFRASVEARRAQKPGGGWRVLPNGTRIKDTYVLAGCFKCGRWLWVEPRNVPSNCPVCNLVQRKDGGKLRLATAEEEKAWEERTTAEWAAYRAAAPQREAELAEYNKRVIQGLKP